MSLQLFLEILFVFFFFGHNEAEVNVHPYNPLVDTDTEAVGYAVPLYEAASKYGAVCLDGTTPRFYYRPGSAETKYYVFFEGGGWCAPLNESVYNWADSCYDRSLTRLGSTINSDDAPYYVIDGGYFSTDPSVNPLMYNWNVVYIRYCDGASYSGDVSNPVINPGDGKKLYFRGARILRGVFEELISNYGFDNATDVIIGGCSAGGLSVYLHVDYIASNFISKEKTNILALPDSGFFLKYVGQSNYTGGMKWVYDHQNSSVNQKCVDYYISQNQNPNECIFAPNVVQFIQTPLFGLQSRFDSWQLTEELENTENVELCNEYGQNLTDLVFNNYFINTENGIFLDSCYHHCGEWDDITINGTVSGQALSEVWNNLYGNNQNNNYDASSQIWFQDEKYYCSDCCQ